MGYVGGTPLLRGEAGSGLNLIPNCCSAYQGPFPQMFHSVTAVGRSCVLLSSVNSLNAWC